MASVSIISNVIYKELGTTEISLVELDANQKGACVGFSLANLKSSTVKASVFVTNGDGVKGYYVKDLQIAANSSARIINGGEKLLLGPNNAVSVVCDLPSALDVIFSLVVITYT